MTEHFFNTDNALWQAVGKAGDLILLTFLTVFCCIPVVTAGASLSALSYVAFRIIEHNNENTWKNFFHSFRQNLAQGIALSIVMLALGFMLTYDIWFMRRFAAMETAGSRLLVVGWGICIFLGLVYTVLCIYLFPLQARYYNSPGVTIKNALLLGILKFPKTLQVLFGDILLVGLTAACYKAIPQIFILPLLFVLPLCAVYNAWVLRDLLGLEPGKMDKPVPDDCS